MNGIIQIPTTAGTRDDLEPTVEEMSGGRPWKYLGVYGPTSGDEKHPVHAWQIGNEPLASYAWSGYVPEVKQTTAREDKSVIYRREVWPGSGEPVGPVDFSRPTPETVTVDFPAPIVGATTEPDPGIEQPGPIVDLARYAQVRGWETMVTYAHGWVPHASYGTPSKAPKESWGVRMRRGADRAVAVRMAGTWASMWTWSGTDRFVHHKTLGAFQEAIA